MMVSQARRILVALDSRPESLAALERAAALASQLDAEIAGLFVEDDSLLRLCELPVVEVMLGVDRTRRLAAATLRREMRARADAARRALERTAAPRRLAWSFRVTRGRLEEEVLRAGPGAAIVAPSRAVRRGAPRRTPAVGAVLGADGDDRTLVLAGHLARAASAPVLVLAPGAALTDPEGLRARIEGAVGTPVTVAGYDAEDEAGLEARIEPLVLGALVLPAPAALDPERLGRLAAAARCDLVVLCERGASD